MKSLRKEYGNVKLIITGGETDYTEKLKELVRKWQLEKVVRFTGYLTETELFKLYQQASIYIYTAPEEDFGMGVTEAMAAGLPVVAWKAGGPAYILKDKQIGFLVEPYQVSEMGRAVSRLIKDKALRLRLGQAGQVEAKRYSWEKHGQCLEKCLIKAIRMAD
jgi:glycosyltransferase involved in cell wall biosynthesis